MKKKEKVLIIIVIVILILVVTLYFSFDKIVNYMVSTMNIQLF